MTAVVFGVLAAAAVLGLTGAHERYPWRAVDLTLRGGSVAVPRPRPRRGRRKRPSPRSEDDVARDLPAVVDLLHLAVTAGHNLHTAVSAAAAAGTGPAAAALRMAVEGFDRGGRLVDQLERLPSRAGEAIRPLTTTLVVAASSGTPLAPALQRLADAERRRLRRRTEERVRRLPLLLLGPLVGLVLPAFVLLTIVPVGITTARSAFDPVAEVRLPSPVDAQRSPP